MLDEETDLVKCYEKIKERWVLLVAETYSDSGEKPKSIDEAMAVLDSHLEAKTVFEKKMADVCEKINLVLSGAEDDLQLKEKQISELPNDDRSAIKKLKQHILVVDMTKDEHIDGGIEGPKGGLIPFPDKRLDYKPIGEWARLIDCYLSNLNPVDNCWIFYCF